MNTLDLRTDEPTRDVEEGNKTRSAKVREYFRTKTRTENRDEEIRRSIQKVTAPRTSPVGTRESVGQKEQRKFSQKALAGAGKMVGKVNPEAGASLSIIGSMTGLVTSPLKAAKEKFGETTVYLMIGTALFFDTLIALIDLFDLFTFGLASILLGSLFDFFALMTFTFWFKIKGASFGARRTTSIVAGFVTKFIPFVDMLPDWTIAIFFSFMQENINAVSATLPAGMGKMIQIAGAGNPLETAV